MNANGRHVKIPIVVWCAECASEQKKCEMWAFDVAQFQIDTKQPDNPINAQTTQSQFSFARNDCSLHVLLFVCHDAWSLRRRRSLVRLAQLLQLLVRCRKSCETVRSNAISLQICNRYRRAVRALLNRLYFTFFHIFYFSPFPMEIFRWRNFSALKYTHCWQININRGRTEPRWIETNRTRMSSRASSRHAGWFTGKMMPSSRRTTTHEPETATREKIVEKQMNDKVNERNKNERHENK